MKNQKNKETPIKLQDVLDEAISVAEGLNLPLDTSLDGLAKAFLYYSEIHKNMKVTIDILKKVEELVDNGRPIIFGKDKWDSEVKELLELFDFQVKTIFGDNIGVSVYNVPAGCGNVWLYYVKIFLEAENLSANLMNLIGGTDSLGLKKANLDIGTISDYMRQLTKERNTLLDAIRGSGVNLDEITNRAKQLITGKP